MFVVEIISALNSPAIRLQASQVVVRLPNGTPVSLAAVFADKAVLVSHCDDTNFQTNLQKLGIPDTVIVERLKLQ